MTVNEKFYRPVTEAVFNKEPFKYFRKQYHLITCDHEEKNYSLWTDYLLDKYNQYKSAGFAPHECEIHSLMDGLEALIGGK